MRRMMLRGAPRVRDEGGAAAQVSFIMYLCLSWITKATTLLLKPVGVSTCTYLPIVSSLDAYQLPRYVCRAELLWSLYPDGLSAYGRNIGFWL